MTENAPGTPFGDDYPDPRDERTRAAERAEVDKQAASLVRLRTDLGYWRERVAALQFRRAGVPDAVQIETAADAGTLMLVAAGRIVARTRDLTDDHRRVLAEFGLPSNGHGRAAVPGIEVFTVRAGRPRTDAAGGSGTFARVAELRMRGVPVGPDHITPLGPVMKGEGGPEPSAGGRPFPAVTYPMVGAPPRVAVIDTGISDEERGDGYLNGLLDPGGANEDLLDVLPPPGDSFLDAGAGHGTFAAGVIAQVAPTATLDIRRAMDTDGIGTAQQVAAQMLQAVDAGATILNLSLGTETVDGRPPLPLLEAVERIATDHPDVLIVCAAGNCGDDRPIWPAAFAGPGGPGPHFPNVVAVAGLDPDGNPAAWSSRGDWVTCSAVGQGVVSTYVRGAEDGDLIQDPHPDTFGRDAWATWTGTSFAAPQIAGGVARICHNQGVTPREALALLLKAGTPIPGWGLAVRILPGT
ncbi:S8/S53 family peptidase [Pseudonocardia acidicola]|uniref:S8/S53 family peptidase n=1 Tax=Pseudonocardia acidicola TaxID=2724939 RepID=A0ABX1SJ71_9PSEU|nr:S8/S53 family peptidase [Pseudonocardia acidicola]NMI01601.1 S8/S53 family peptidase [Pseudonocardia acidicola]